MSLWRIGGGLFGIAHYLGVYGQCGSGSCVRRRSCERARPGSAVSAVGRMRMEWTSGRNVKVGSGGEESWWLMRCALSCTTR
jgi:hypothetical protein